ncbi:MAG: hypothetical protein WCD76_17385 [Pyrinomonadaceae bacterium]
MTGSLFDSQITREPRSIAILKKAAAAFLAFAFLIAMLSGYRAYVQVRELDISTNESVLRGGAIVRTSAITSGRAYVQVRVEIIQGAHTETLATREVPKNYLAAIDPRPQCASFETTLTPELLARFRPGPASLRATATGSPQWLRVPPPTARELAVDIFHDASETVSDAARP